MAKYRCIVCMEEFELEDGQEQICPVCGVGQQDLERIEEE